MCYLNGGSQQNQGGWGGELPYFLSKTIRIILGAVLFVENHNVNSMYLKK